MSVTTDFIAMVLPGAQEVQRERGMFASVTIAQAILETGSGMYVPEDINTGENSFNLFGRKARSDEPFVLANTHEVVNGVRISVVAKFRKFRSYEESVLDRSTFLKLPWYQRACNATNAFDAAIFLIDTGFRGYSYATDPHYISSLHSIMKAYNLTQYDLPKGEDDMNKVLDYEEWAWKELDTYLGNAYNDKIINEWSWVQKVRDHKLTYSDLLLLKVLIDERRRAKTNK